MSTTTTTTTKGIAPTCGSLDNTRGANESARGFSNTINSLDFVFVMGLAPVLFDPFRSAVEGSGLPPGIREALPEEAGCTKKLCGGVSVSPARVHVF